MFQLLCAVYVAATLAHVQSRPAVDKGYFWHVSDFHYDLTYWTKGLSCNGPVPTPGPYGDYWCDAPWSLVQDSIKAMAEVKADVDFVLWTGDNVAHIDDKYMDLETNLAIMKNVTSAINASFPSVPVYPSLGNHDFYPHDQAEAKTDRMYKSMAAMWAGWIKDPEQIDNFRKGGYYTSLVRPGLRLLGLNTILYFFPNPLTKNMTDPTGQFEWMERVLTSARANGEKVLVSAHVPPGLFVPDFIYWMYPQYQHSFHRIMLDFSDVIAGQYYGHDHTDTFKIVQNEKGQQASPMYTAPSVTPWRYRAPTKSGDPHNPGVRLVEYDRTTGLGLNYMQYFINLTDSNRQNATHWTVLYNFQDAYKVPDMSVTSLRKIFHSMRHKGSEPMLKYCDYLMVSNYTQTCTDEMQAEIWCGGQIEDMTTAKKCIKKYKSGAVDLESLGLNNVVMMNGG
ncbi:acid sphingomyelinase-like phosphodiesterase 3a [Aplysia californica]|uniref:Acid sphingomyelinase-like phosphodiesterase 3a n=1 Tax=Aplysia californica TaxID=6500 RepID=A0ABM1A2B9_APLCA|nr:acid sphingomyelinase-like phosphodiesterase 3a [Aplysia californica]